MKLICSVYRSTRHEGMYLYVEKSVGVEKVPDVLIKKFGVAEHAMTLVLSEERKLAQADVSKVISAIQEQGFYLQLPPQPEQDMASVAEKNSKMPR